jgi:signal recognition particle GTPase
MAKNAVTGSVESNKEKQWQLMLQQMTSDGKWSLRKWKGIIDTQVSSWTMYIPGVSSSAEAKDMKSFKAMLDSFSDTELDDASKINSLTRERVAKTSGKSIDDVNRLIFAYKQSDIISNWLSLKKSLGESLPKTEEELHTLQASDLRLRNIAKKIMNPKGVKSGRGRHSPF